MKDYKKIDQVLFFITVSLLFTSCILSIFKMMIPAAFILSIGLLFLFAQLVIKQLDNTIYFAKVRDDAIIPTKTLENGCYDIYANFEDSKIKIEPFSNKLIPTGICSGFSSSYRIGIRERGSNTKANEIVMAGQIDSGFTGEWFVSIYNGNSVPLYISKGVKNVEREEDAIYVPYSKAIAQFAVEFVPPVLSKEVKLEKIQKRKTERGNGMLGSSGK